MNMQTMHQVRTSHPLLCLPQHKPRVPVLAPRQQPGPLLSVGAAHTYLLYFTAALRTSCNEPAGHASTVHQLVSPVQRTSA